MGPALELADDPAPGVIRGALGKVELLRMLLEFAASLTPFELSVLIGEIVSGVSPAVKESELLKRVKPGLPAELARPDRGIRRN